MSAVDADGSTRRWRGLPRAVWALGIVSLCMDLSSEMIHGLLPAFLSVELGVGAVALGLLEGGSEAIASALKIASGAWSDRTRRRKSLAVLGYALSALSKPLFPMADSFVLIAGARAIDRVGKGIRGAPRDALVADITPPQVRGAAYGLRQALDTIGAVLGPVIAVAWMLGSGDDFRAVFAIAVIPAVLAVLVLVFGVREPVTPTASPGKPPMRWSDMARLPRGVWVVVGLAFAIGVARLGETFLVLSVLDTGLAVAWSPLALVAMNVVYAAMAYPAGRLSDRRPRPQVLLVSCAVLLVGHGTLALASGLLAVAIGIALFGAHMALAQGLLSAWLSDRAPAEQRGVAFGALHLANGLAAIVGGAAAGVAWSQGGMGLTYAMGVGLAAIACGLVAMAMRR